MSKRTLESPTLAAGLQSLSSGLFAIMQMGLCWGKACRVHQTPFTPGSETLRFVSVQVNDRTCPLGIGHVPGTPLDLRRACGVTEKTRVLGSQRPQFESWPYHVPAVWLWARFLMLWILSFLTCKIKTIVTGSGCWKMKVHGTCKTTSTVTSAQEELNKPWFLPSS